MLQKPEHIQRIEKKIDQLIDRHNSVTAENEKLKKELSQHLHDIESLKNKIGQLEKDLASERKNTKNEAEGINKLALEKKINDYIKEIDKCISLLGEGA